MKGPEVAKIFDLWWRDKPPVTRWWIVVGLAVGVILTVAAMVLDQIGTGTPALQAFIWDLAKASLIGTVVLAVVADVRAWGTGWRVTQANMPELVDAAQEVVLTSGAGLMPPERLGPSQFPTTVVRHSRALSEFLSGLENRSEVGWSDVEEGWTATIGAGGSDPGLRERLAAADPSVIHDKSEDACARLCQVFGKLSDQTSVIRARSLAGVVVRLRDFPNEVAEVHAFLRTCATEGSAPLSSSRAFHVSATLHLLNGALELVSKEADTGRPHGRREWRYWDDGPAD